ncbi:hypothetical protein, partial [Candidatus Magnetobacterium casense]|uniref:hypothetical protein n=1 Tax=Candidatus Magnetobacterium casense TaxID=1455061 RepID=UPI001C45DF7C
SNSKRTVLVAHPASPRNDTSVSSLYFCTFLLTGFLCGFLKWIPVFTGMTRNGILRPSVSFLRKQESRKCETIDTIKINI